MSFLQVGGRFIKVGPIRVRQRWPHLSRTYWSPGHPVGILFHYTAGCSAGVFGRGTIGAQFNIDREGNIYQSDSVKAATWHAYEGSHYWVGIEHTAWPGHCELTDKQLESSAILSAALVQYIKKTWGVTVPLTHFARPNFDPGFKDHRDGTTSTWNHDGHTDHLYRWTWETYLRKVKEAMSPMRIVKHWFVEVEGQPTRRVFNLRQLLSFFRKAAGVYKSVPPKAPVDFKVTYDPVGEEI